MRLGKKKVAIGLAVGTLLTVLLTVATYGSASKCASNCGGSEISSDWLEAKKAFKDSAKIDYAAAVVSPLKTVASAAGPKIKTVAKKADVKTYTARKTAKDREVEHYKKALVAILLVLATESIQQPSSH